MYYQNQPFHYMKHIARNSNYPICPDTPTVHFLLTGGLGEHEAFLLSSYSEP